MNDKREIGFFFIMIFAMLLWGASWVSGKLVSSAVHPDLLVFWRFLFCFAGFLALYPWRRFDLRLSLPVMLLLLLNGVLMNIYNQLFFIGLHYGLAGKGGVIVTSLNPVFTFILGALIFRYPFLRLQKIGIILGILGGFLLLEPWKFSAAEIFGSSNMIFVAAGLLWSAITLLTGRIMEKGVGIFTYNFYFYLVSFAVSALPASDNHPFNFAQYSAGFWINIVYLSVFATIISTTLYFAATRRIGAGRASSFTLLVPAFAVLISWAVLGEVPQIFTILGGGLALSAVYLINLGQRKRPPVRVSSR